MSNILKIPLNKIRQEGNYKELLDAIDILERGMSDTKSNGLDELLAKKLDNTIEFCRSLISHIINGIKETPENKVENLL